MIRLTVCAVCCLAVASCATRRTGESRTGEAAGKAVEPIRPGEPGKSPFWNGNAKQFIWPPAFDFKPVAGATGYRFTLVPHEPRHEGVWTFEAKEPWAALTPVWDRIPTGTVDLKVEALNESRVIGVAGERTFHRAAAFNGPASPAVMPYDRSASWRSTP